MKNSIYYKILLAYIFLAIVSLLLINTVISSSVYDYEVERNAKELYSQATSASNHYSKTHYNIYSQSEYDYTEDLSTFFLSSDESIWIIGTNNKVLYSSSTAWHPTIIPDISDYFGNSYYATGNFNSLSSSNYLTVYSPIVNDFHTYGYVFMNRNITSIQDKHIYIMNTINIVFTIFFILSMSVLLVFSSSVYQPLTKIMNAANEYAKGNYEYEGLKIRSHDEMRILADSLNFVSGSFRNLYDSQKKFIANISHDFRSPLTSIKGYVEAILDGTIPPEMQEKYLHIVVTETERLNKLTSSLLTLNTFDSQGIMLDLSDFDFLKIIKDTVASFEGQCNAKNIKIKLSHEDKDYQVNADQVRIQQVVYNLIDNAIKFSPNNADIIVDLSDRNNKVYVTVKDFGTGIPADDLPKIFNRFYKVDSSRGKDKKGTGLGLSIVKEIISAHNENINVISTEGVGTQFVFTIAKSK